MHNTNCPGRFSKGTIITVIKYVESLDYVEAINKSTGRITIIKRRHLQLPKKPRQIHDTSLVQHTFPILYMDAMTLHRVQGASLDSLIKIMIHQDLWVATQIYVGISRTTNKDNLHILLWDDQFFDKTIKQLYQKENLQTCLKANKKILKDDSKFRKMFQKIKTMGHKWYDAKTCVCLLCQQKKKYELKLLEQ